MKQSFLENLPEGYLVSGIGITVGHLRRAAAALEGEDG